MKRTLLFKLLITWGIFILSSNGQSCPCSNVNDILQCNVINNSSDVNTDLCSLDEYDSISIIYTGNVVLNLNASAVKPIFIKPVDGSDSHTLQISTINTNAPRIEIHIFLSSNQTSIPLLTASSSIIAATSTLSINVVQNITDAIDFKVFGSSSSAKMNFANYEVIFTTATTNSGSLSLSNLISGLTNLTSMTISGDNHILVVNSAQMPSAITVNQLSLKNLRLYDQILYNFYSLQGYSIEGCEYNETSLFLNSTRKYNISLEMTNNNPLNAVLPFRDYAFEQLGTLTNLTLIESKLNSSCLKAIKTLLYPANVLINLNQYYTSDLNNWGAIKPTVWQLTMQNIQDLSVFPAVFINKFQAVQRVTLQGTFDLQKQDICIFVGMIRQIDAINPILVLDSSKKNSNDWDSCADTYVTAINVASINDITCPPDNSCEACQQWATATEQCNLISYENGCTGPVDIYGKIFFYNNSYLYQFFKNSLWLNGTTYSSKPPISKQDTINIGAIVGSLCGLLIAIIILAVTIFCIYRYRQKDANRNMFSTPEEKYKPSSYDSTHVSIATSKTSKSSRYALERSFFPPMQPHDEIAPPLYTAPSESVGSISAYNLPSAPPAPRDSISTHATHLYETLDS